MAARAASVVSAALITAGTRSVQAAKPNIVFVLIDDLGYNDAGWRPGPDGPSTDLADAWPVARHFAEQGVTLRHYYTQPICTPTRGAFMSGRFPIRLGLQHAVINPGTPYGLPVSEVTLAEKMSAGGYHVMGVGKWHLGAHARNTLPTSRGFDEFYGYWYGWSDYWDHALGPGGPGSCIPGSCFLDLHDGFDLDATQNGTYGTYLYASKAEEMMRRHRASRDLDDGNHKPFFLYYAMQNVHDPLEAPDEFLQKAPCSAITNHNRKVFCALSLLADEAFANLTDTVTTLFADEDVLVIVSGDNGGQVHSGGNNLPLKGAKAGLWEGGVRNNAFLWSSSDALLPASARGSVYDGLVHVTDLHATILAAADLDPSDPPIDGVSHLAAIAGLEASPRTEFLINIDPNAGSMRPDGAGNLREAAYRMKDWKYLLNVAEDTWYELSGSDTVAPGKRVSGLYNITADPEERTDLSAEFPEVVAEILTKIEMLDSEQLLPCNCGDYCDASRGQILCPVDDNAIVAATAAGGWVPWLADTATVRLIV